MWQRFTDDARRTVFYAQEEAAALGVHMVGSEHLLLALVRRDEGVVPTLLQRLNVSLEAVRSELVLHLSRGTGQDATDMMLTPRAKRVIDLAYVEARELQSNCIGSEHLFLGILREGEGIAALVLVKFGVNVARTRALVEEILDAQAQEEADAQPATASPARDSERAPARPERRVTGTGIGPGAWVVMEMAVRHAQSLGAEEVEVEHLWLALLGDSTSDTVRYLTSHGVNLTALLHRLTDRLS